MKFIHRLGFYLGGFALGLILLMFFLNGKEASCDYSPNSRTVKNISSKPLRYSNNAFTALSQYGIDSLTVKQLIKYGVVDFSESNINKDSCNIYQINSIYKEQDILLNVKNCDSLALLLTVLFLSKN